MARTKKQQVVVAEPELTAEEWRAKAEEYLTRKVAAEIEEARAAYADKLASFMERAKISLLDSMNWASMDTMRAEARKQLWERAGKHLSSAPTARVQAELLQALWEQWGEDLSFCPWEHNSTCPIQNVVNQVEASAKQKVVTRIAYILSEYRALLAKADEAEKKEG